MTISQHVVTGLFFAILGSCLGSFLNVCAYRVPRGMSILHPRSRCPRCGAGILARDNVPILGWLLLRGRCRRCRCAIPMRYAVVEVAVGLLFAFAYLALAAIAGGDPWERLGTGRVLGLLLASWVATVLAAFAILVGRDPGRPLRAIPAPEKRRQGGRREYPRSIAPASRTDRG